MADKDGDLTATKEEFTAFLHPEEYNYMKDIVVQVGAPPPPPAPKTAGRRHGALEHAGDVAARGGGSDARPTALCPAQETMEDIDKNGDGFIDLEEYIGEEAAPGL